VTRRQAADDDDDLSSGLAVDHVPDGRWNVAERVSPVDSRRDLSGFEELPESYQIFGVLR
jgi:hypothetical protein